MSVSVYVAAPWKEKEAARRARFLLQQAGFLVPARWIDAPDTSDASELALHAERDLTDIALSHGLLLLNECLSAGKEFELGYAYARRLPLFAVGAPTSCFHFLSVIKWDATLEEAVERMRRYYGL